MIAIGKISPVSIKYNIIAKISLTGIADRPDVIGAIFGQTEGLLGSELELRELQKTGKIGRIEVTLRNRSGKSEGEIIIPSSMGKSETAIIAAAIETIDRVGPCNAKIRVEEIQDVRISKRDFILKRAEELLKELVKSLPDSAEFTNIVTQTVRAMEVTEYGKDKLPAGPMIDGSDEIIVVEGRADVINLLKYGIRNVVALNGKDSSGTLIDLMHKKVVTLFVDGDRGGDLVIKKLANMADIDFIARAPDGKEVEELTLKEIQKALRAKQNWEQFSEEAGISELKAPAPQQTEKPISRLKESRERQRAKHYPDRFMQKYNAVLKELSEDLIGTRGAYVLDDGLNILGKVPVKELRETLRDIGEPVFAIIMDGAIDKSLAQAIDKKRVRYIITKSNKNEPTRAKVIPAREL